MNFKSERYFVIDIAKLERDVRVANTAMGGRVSLTRRLEQLGIAPQVFSNAKTNASRKGCVSLGYEPADEYGRIYILYLDAICREFNLNKQDYILKLKDREPVDCNAQGDYVSVGIVSKLDEISEKLDRILNLWM